MTRKINCLLYFQPILFELYMNANVIMQTTTAIFCFHTANLIASILKYVSTQRNIDLEIY